MIRWCWRWFITRSRLLDAKKLLQKKNPINIGFILELFCFNIHIATCNYSFIFSCIASGGLYLSHVDRHVHEIYDLSFIPKSQQAFATPSTFARLPSVVAVAATETKNQPSFVLYLQRNLRVLFIYVLLSVLPSSRFCLFKNSLTLPTVSFFLIHSRRKKYELKYFKNSYWRKYILLILESLKPET